MNDLINRQDAIDAIKYWWTYGGWQRLYDEVSNLPSAQWKGKWIHYGAKWEYRFRCSMCNYHLLGHKTNFCPNCGADMQPDNAPLADDDCIYG